MLGFNQHKRELIEKGFSITSTIFSDEEIENLKKLINSPKDTYAIRQLFVNNPAIMEIVLSNDKFKRLISEVCEDDYFITKAIYFNKPAKSNWFVSHHQDISISAENKIEAENYTNWTNKKGQLGVVPPLEILENTVTFRIHLDDTDETNGALKVIPKSHSKGFIRVDEKFKVQEHGEEQLCKVRKGEVMLMKPLLLHASQKSISSTDRSVIHMELCNRNIPMGWLEKKEIV
ncbi:phytanoyl-CoA dioxygenase family protein [Tenacibaculum sp.]|uniref:phytanoyl-CoA dioxygenase family protein n=1 Tax=Tenacibaculum sp. TaxID=1906242 RepID=UPI003D0BA900